MAVRERVIEVEVIIGVRDLVVWMLAVVRPILVVLLVVEDMDIWKVVCMVGTEEKSRAVVVGFFPRVVVVMGGENMAEVSLLVVAGVMQVVVS